MTTTEIKPQVEPKYEEYTPAETPEKKSRLFVFLLVCVLALLILGAFTLLQRRTQYRALANETEKMAVPTVSVVHPTTEPGQEDLVLPSTTQAYVESPIYARTNGYLKKWYHDIGTRVRQGELLARIGTSDLGFGSTLHDAGLCGIADLRANQRILEKVVPRHWNPRASRGVAGGYWHA